MKHFGRSLLNPTITAARRDFAVGPVLDDAAESADFEFRNDARGDGAMRQAFRKAKTARDDRRREERAGGRRHDGHR